MKYLYKFIDKYLNNKIGEFLVFLYDETFSIIGLSLSIAVFIYFLNMVELPFKVDIFKGGIL